MALNGQNICGERVRRYRLRLPNNKFPGRPVSQEVLAARAQAMGWDIGRDVIAKIELGERCVTDKELEQLAKLLNCTPHNLIGWNE